MIQNLDRVLFKLPNFHSKRTRNKRGVFLLASLFTTLILFFFPLRLFAGVPVADNLFVTDVTTVSFSAIWSTNEPCTAGIEVYSDSSGATQVLGISITPHPVLSGSLAIKTAAEDSGVMKVMVTGL